MDATCGNGHDTHVLASTGADVIACDVQGAALDQTRERVKPFDTIRLFQICHSELVKVLEGRRIALLVYNLGYLPGGDKQITTVTASTLLSLQRLLPHVESGGWVSITCYPGHMEGEREQHALVFWSSQLNSSEWDVTHIQWISRPRAPSLLLLHRHERSKAFS